MCGGEKQTSRADRDRERQRKREEEKETGDRKATETNYKFSSGFGGLGGRGTHLKPRFCEADKSEETHKPETKPTKPKQPIQKTNKLFCGKKELYCFEGTSPFVCGVLRYDPVSSSQWW